MKSNKLVKALAIGVISTAALLPLSGCLESKYDSQNNNKNKISKDDMGPLRPSSEVNRPFNYDLWHTYERRKGNGTL